jgi:hypothetical protein
LQPSAFVRDQPFHHLSEESDRSPGDFHSTGASDVARQDSRGTKPARVTLNCGPNALYQGSRRIAKEIRSQRNVLVK